MTDLSSDKRVQRAALALNNEAVSLLLPQGKFELAKKALGSSLEIMETLMLGCFDDDEEGGGPGEETAEEAKHNKMLLLRSLEHSRRPTEHLRQKIQGDNNRSSADPNSNISTTNNRVQILPFDIHVLEDHDFGALRSAMRYGGSASVCFPILLRDEFMSAHGAHEPLDLLTLSRQYAVILYNTALAYRMHGECEYYQQRWQPGQQAQRPRNEAIKIAQRLLSCSNSVLSSLVTETSKQEFQNAINGVARIQLLLVAGLVLNQFAFVLFACQHEQQGTMALRSVENLGGVLDQYPIMFSPALVSPAA